MARTGEESAYGATPCDPWRASSSRGSEGYLGVLAHHAALVTALAPGDLTLRAPGGREERMQVSGGFFEVSANRATVLADQVSGAAAAKE